MEKAHSLYVDPAWIRKGGVALIPIPVQSKYAGYHALIDVRDAGVDRNHLNCLMISRKDNEVVLIRKEKHDGFFISFERFLYAMEKENRFDGNKVEYDKK